MDSPAYVVLVIALRAQYIKGLQGQRYPAKQAPSVSHLSCVQAQLSSQSVLESRSLSRWQ